MWTRVGTLTLKQPSSAQQSALRQHLRGLSCPMPIGDSSAADGKRETLPESGRFQTAELILVWAYQKTYRSGKMWREE